MTDSANMAQILGLLERTLEAYGGDPSRWPASTRVQLQAFISSNRIAQSKLAEAQSLDRVLGFAPDLSARQNTELAQRIVHAAERQPRAVGSQTLPARRPTPPFGSRGIAAAALAASLVLGILTGQSTVIGSLADALVTGDTASLSQQLALGDDGETLLDEDLL